MKKLLITAFIASGIMVTPTYAQDQGNAIYQNPSGQIVLNTDALSEELASNVLNIADSIVAKERESVAEGNLSELLAERFAELVEASSVRLVTAPPTIDGKTYQMFAESGLFEQMNSEVVVIGRYNSAEESSDTSIAAYVGKDVVSKTTIHVSSAMEIEGGDMLEQLLVEVVGSASQDVLLPYGEIARQIYQTMEERKVAENRY